MDPFAHTLFGATLAETGLKRCSRYATATLIIGANLPDIDVLAYIGGSDFALYARRGWTHGVLAMLVLPLLLAASIALWHRWRGRASDTNTPAFNFTNIVLLSYLAVWSHPLLDWMNTYGVRLLMPFDDRWFYGDTLFIIDPWFWLLMAAGVVLARSSSRLSSAAWAGFGVLACLLVIGTDRVALAVKVLFVAGVMGIGLLRSVKPDQARIFWLARGCLLALCGYIGVTYLIARHAEHTQLVQFPGARQVQANPIPGNPFQHRLIVVNDTEYHVIGADGAQYQIPRQAPSAIVQSAMNDPTIRGFMHWTRFPYWHVETLPDSWEVTLRDLRYVAPDQSTPSGIGIVQVRVPRNESAIPLSEQ